MTIWSSGGEFKAKLAFGYQIMGRMTETMKFSNIQEAFGKSIAEETVREDEHARGQFKLIYRVANRNNLEFENFSDAMLAAGNDITKISSKRIYINWN